MFEIDLPYEKFKEIVLHKGLLWQYIECTDSTSCNKYNIFAIDDKIKYNTIIYKNPQEITGIDVEKEENNTLDFETNYKHLSNRPLAITPIGIYSNFQGRRIEIAENEESGYCEWIFDRKVSLNKILPIIINAEWGDYIELEILLHDNTPILKYASTIYIYGSSTIPWFQGVGAGEIPLGFKVRATYNKAEGSNTARRCILIAEFLEG